jgi:hypothetical protein
VNFLLLISQDGSGALSEFELESAVADLNMNMSSKEIKLLMAHLDEVCPSHAHCMIEQKHA